MVTKGQWVVLPYLVSKYLPGSRPIPPGVKKERDQRPRWIGCYSSSKLNYKTLPIVIMYSMQYVRALERLIREVVIYDLALVPVYVLKADVSDSFYCIGLQPTGAPNMGLVFPSEGETRSQYQHH